MLKKWFCLSVAAGMIVSSGLSVLAQEAEGAEEGTDEAAKMVKVTTMEEAFVRALQSRQQLANRVVLLVRALRDEEDDAKKEQLRQELAKANKALQTVKVAMEVIFGIGNRREYEYVAKTIYLKVGTVPETFTRAVQTREALKQAIAQKAKEKEEAEDAETTQKLEKEIAELTRRYQVVAASLQLVFGVAPQRNYTYNPQNATLYLNVTDEEVEQLKAKLAELQDKQAAAAKETADAPEDE